MAGAVSQRERYRPEPGMKWSLIGLLVALPIGTGVVVAALLNMAYEYGHYYYFVLPLFAAALLSGATSLAVWWTHCNRRYLAAALGICAGLTGYLGYYHFGLMRLLPAQQAHRVDWLPTYIDFRMQTDVQVDAAQAVDDDDPLPENDAVDIFGNWMFFMFELGIMVCIPTGIAWKLAGRAYCSELRQWMQLELVTIARGQGARLRKAFEAGELDEFVESVQATELAANQSEARCTLEYVKTDNRSPLEFPVYLTVKDGRIGFGYGSGFRQIQLETQEVLALRPLFAGLTSALAVSHPELQSVPEVEVEVELVSDVDQTATEVAQIEPVPEPYGGRVFTRGHKIMSNIVALPPLVALLGGLGLAGLGIYRFDGGADWLRAALPFVVGVALVLVGIAWGLWYNGLMECLYNRRKLRQALRVRPDVVVQPDDHQAFSVSISLRENWKKVMLDIASDIGLMRLDEQAGHIYIEADHERFRIPAGSLLACEAECFTAPLDQKTQNWLVRLVVRLPEGSREILFSRSHTDLRPRNDLMRQAIAADLCRRILSLPGAQLGASGALLPKNG